ncbi:MAG: 50S ribosomal protein L11 methyltransferase [Flavobacteriaceae bacterium]|nr:50S ribosomal protein L11 methyltransferase [Flavobacteriaceae bacterium]
MSQTYIGYHFTIVPLQPASDILMAELGEIGFESFVETETGFSAYIPKTDWNPDALHKLQVLNSGEFSIVYEKEEIAPVNWNSEWEKNFEPIEIENTVSIRAPFHEAGTVQYNLIIEPKMSFGTGHHETTHLMVQHLLKLDLQNKTVLDMGCGTAVLAILAEKLGAQPIDAIDIDSWSYENAVENVERNACNHISVYEGDANLLTDQHYDVIIANINRNILLADLPAYTQVLKSNGILLLSGFYTEDIPTILDVAEKLNLNCELTLERHNWVGLRLKKTS